MKLSLRGVGGRSAAVEVPGPGTRSPQSTRGRARGLTLEGRVCALSAQTSGGRASFGSPPALVAPAPEGALSGVLLAAATTTHRIVEANEGFGSLVERASKTCGLAPLDAGGVEASRELAPIGVARARVAGRGRAPTCSGPTCPVSQDAGPQRHAAGLALDARPRRHARRATPAPFNVVTSVTPHGTYRR